MCAQFHSAYCLHMCVSTKLIFSPDFNPIETCWAHLKGWCRRNGSQLRALGFSEVNIIQQAFQSFSIASVNNTIGSIVYSP